MPKVDVQTRERIRRWVWFFMGLHNIPNPAQMAKELGVAVPTVWNILEGTRGAGLDFLLKLRHRFKWPLDPIVEDDPPWEKYKVSLPRDAPPEILQPPQAKEEEPRGTASSASRTPAESTRRTRHGGHR